MGICLLPLQNAELGAGAGDRQGHPAASLLPHVMMAKFADPLQLYQQEKIFGRAGLTYSFSLWSMR